MFDPSQMGAPAPAAPPIDPAMASAPAEPTAAESIEELLDRQRLELQQKMLEDGTISAEERLLIQAMEQAQAKFLAKREKEEQAALGGGPATNFLRRSVGG